MRRVPNAIEQISTFRPTIFETRLYSIAVVQRNIACFTYVKKKKKNEQSEINKIIICLRTCGMLWSSIDNIPNSLWFSVNNSAGVNAFKNYPFSFSLVRRRSNRYV